MSARNTKAYWLIPHTNLHAGSGDTNYGIVDKEVQRDQIEGTPVIHSSGLKGSLRELLTTELGKESEAVKYIFGDGHKNKEAAGNASGNYTAGSYHFYEARLLTLPVRSNAATYFSATSPELIKAFLKESKTFTGKTQCSELTALTKLKPAKGQPIFFANPGELSGKVMIEDWEARNGLTSDLAPEEFKPCGEILGNNLALMHQDDFKEACRNLPVIARNNLDNGISQNLWYEEVVPRRSRFYFFIGNSGGVPQGFGFTSNMNKKKLWNKIQVGGNATIGYGLCSIKSIKPLTIDKITENAK